MKGKVNILVAISLVVLVGMFGFSGYLLFRGIRSYSSAQKKADGLYRKLSAHYTENPFPSEMNVDTRGANARQLNEWSESLLTELRKGDVNTEERSPSRFMAMVGRTRNALLSSALEHRVDVNPEFAFGFDRYLGLESALPPPRVVPKVTQQLVFIQEITEIMLTNGVSAISLIEREDPEEEGTGSTRTSPRATATRGRTGRTRGRGGRQAAPVVNAPENEDDSAADAEKSLYSTFNFKFDIKVKERALLAILNQLTAHRGFVTVKRVEFRREGDDVIAVEPVEPKLVLTPSGEERKLWPDRQQRVIAGPSLEQPMLVHLDIDVFRFTGDTSSASDQ